MGDCCRDKKRLTLLEVARNSTKKLVKPDAGHVKTYWCRDCGFYHFISEDKERHVMEEGESNGVD
jgi:hypothetical protein